MARTPARISCLWVIFALLQGAQGADFGPRNFGAAGDGKTIDTLAFQKAIDACANAGGGRVVVPGGTYLIGGIQMRANITLVLQEHTILKGSPDPADYPLMSVRYEGEFVQGHRALIYAENADNIAIVGPGVLIGDSQIGQLRHPRGPLMLEFVNCNNILLKDFAVHYRRLWSIHLLYCQNVLAENLTLRTTQTNGDGFDVDSTAHVLIENCDIDTGDDCVALKSGRGVDAVRIARPTEDVEVRHCLLGSGFAGVAIGSEMSGGIRNVRIDHCDFTHGANAIFIKSRIGRGGSIEDISAEYLQASTRTFLGISLRNTGIVGSKPLVGLEAIPRASHISIARATVDCETLVDGTHIPPEKPLDGLSLSGITGDCQRSISLANAVNVQLKNISVAGYSGPFLETRNVTGAGLERAVAIPLPMMEDPDQLRQAFAKPPDDARPMVRWWWFGPAVTKPELQHEMELMRQAGFAGFEIQPTYPLALDGQIPGLVNLKFLSPEFLDALNFTAAKSQDLGLRMDLTLGSGWPYGGSMFALSDAAQCLRIEKNPAAPLRNGETLLANFDDRAGSVFRFISSHTGMKVKRPAFGAEGYVIDHQSTSAVRKFLDSVAQPELSACGQNPPHAIFCDSLESYGEDWTADFLDEFQKRRGYDLRPLLQELIPDGHGPMTLDVRHDWGQTLTELFNDHFQKQVHAFAASHHTRFRVQAYGTPSAGLCSYLDCDFPEGEGFQWHDYTMSRYASSACHLLGIPISSSETFTWIHSPVFRATPLDIKAEADLHFLQGINQIICHGWPYTAPGINFPGWSFYAAGVFDDQNPWSIVMPDVNRYLQRVSFMMRQGIPANDIALYLSNSDAWAKFTPGHASLTDHLGECLGPAIVGDILDAGYNFDYFDDGILAARGKIDRGSLAFGKEKYRIVILAGVERMPLPTLRKLENFAEHGGLLVATRRLPSRAPGYQATDQDQKEFQAIAQRLFQNSGAPGIFVKDENQLGEALTKKSPPDVRFSPASPEIGFVRRQTDGGELYFVANTGNQPKTVSATFRFEAVRADRMDAITGTITQIQILEHPENCTTVNLDLAPYGSTIILLSNRTSTPTVIPSQNPPSTIDLKTGWTIRFNPDGKPVPLETLHSWTEDPSTRYFSGIASYSNHITLSPGTLASGSRITIDFATPTPAPPPPDHPMGYSANLNAPLRDAAVVFINNTRVGSIWCAPYRLDVTDFLAPGDNRIRIDVANTAVNYLAAHGFPNYDNAALAKTFGARFQPPAAAQFQPIASGLIGDVTLMIRPQ